MLLPGSAAHPFYPRLTQIVYRHDFGGYVERLCQRFYADEGRPGLPPGRNFRLLLIGYFEGLDAERAIAWRAADSFALRDFLGLVLPEAPPDHSTISRTRRLDQSRDARRRLHLDGSSWRFRRRCAVTTAGARGPGQDKDRRHRRADAWRPMRHCAASCGATRARATGIS